MVARRSVSDWPARRAFQTVTIHHTNPTSPPSDSAAPSQIRISMAGFLLGLRTIAPARKRKRCALQALRADAACMATLARLVMRPVQSGGPNERYDVRQHLSRDRR